MLAAQGFLSQSDIVTHAEISPHRFANAGKKAGKFYASHR
jgi:hypothetical protein